MPGDVPIRARDRVTLRREEVGRLLARDPMVDSVGLEARAASLAAPSIARSKRWTLDRLIRCMDLTSLDGSETTETIVELCSTAARPNPLDASVPSVAAVCVYPSMVPIAVEQLHDSGVRVASVAGAFPSGLGPLEARLGEIGDVVSAGADEVDVVLNRSLVVDGRFTPAFDELLAVREAAGPAILKVILETGELGSPDRIRRASLLAMAAGADFIKSSTGKVAVNATLASALCMMEAVRDFARETGRDVGVKVAGGIRSADQAVRYLALLSEVLGPEWMMPDRFRIGASSLLADVLERIAEDGNGTDATETSYL